MEDLTTFDTDRYDSIAREAYDDGKQAFNYDFAMDENPYVDEDIDLALAWEHGWKDGEGEFNRRRR